MTTSPLPEFSDNQQNLMLTIDDLRQERGPILWNLSLALLTSQANLRAEYTQPFFEPPPTRYEVTPSMDPKAPGARGILSGGTAIGTAERVQDSHNWGLISACGNHSPEACIVTLMLFIECVPEIGAIHVELCGRRESQEVFMVEDYLDRIEEGLWGKPYERWTKEFVARYMLIKPFFRWANGAMGKDMMKKVGDLLVDEDASKILSDDVDVQARAKFAGVDGARRVMYGIAVAHLAYTSRLGNIE